MKIAIITGISGQDGAYLAQLLLSKGYKVIGIIRLNQKLLLNGLSFLNIKDKVKIEKLDLLNKESVKKLIKKYKPNEFYNLAAQSSVGLSFNMPLSTFEFNTLSVINILEAIRKFSVETKYYQASSSEMFGNIGLANLPLKEKVLFHPVSPYGTSKASAHWLTVNYREAYGLKACCGILFNHESCLRGENFVIKKIIRSGIEIINGDRKVLKLGNLAIQRDWGYAPKFVEAMWLMLQQEEFNEYLICSGQVTDLLTFVKMTFKKLGLDVDSCLEIDESLMRNLDLDVIYGDNSKAKNEIGWNYDLNTEQLIEMLIEDEKKYLIWRKSEL